MIDRQVLENVLCLPVHLASSDHKELELQGPDCRRRTTIKVLVKHCIKSHHLGFFVVFFSLVMHVVQTKTRFSVQEI